MHTIDITPLIKNPDSPIWNRLELTKILDWLIDNFTEGTYKFDSFLSNGARKIVLILNNEDDRILFRLRWGA